MIDQAVEAIERAIGNLSAPQFVEAARRLATRCASTFEQSTFQFGTNQEDAEAWSRIESVLFAAVHALTKGK